MSEGGRVLELSTRLNLSLKRLSEGSSDAVDSVRHELDHTHPRLSVELLSVKAVAAGVGVSYGHTFVTASQTCLGLAAMGYGDGLPRKAGNRSRVTVHVDGVESVPIVGRIAMNAFVVDLGRLDMKQGERVVVFGNPERGEVSLAEWVDSIGESAVSVLAGIAARVTVRESA